MNLLDIFNQKITRKFTFEELNTIGDMLSKIDCSINPAELTRVMADLSKSIDPTLKSKLEPGENQ